MLRFLFDITLILIYKKIRFMMNKKVLDLTIVLRFINKDIHTFFRENIFLFKWLISPVFL